MPCDIFNKPHWPTFVKPLPETRHVRDKTIDSVPIQWSIDCTFWALVTHLKGVYSVFNDIQVRHSVLKIRIIIYIMASQSPHPWVASCIRLPICGSSVFFLNIHLYLQHNLFRKIGYVFRVSGPLYIDQLCNRPITFQDLIHCSINVIFKLVRLFFQRLFKGT